MSPIPSGPRGMYFDEFQTGQKIITAGRTITEADIVSFAGLSGDYNQIHVDADYSARAPFGQRVAHGLLVTAIGSGLAMQTGVMEGTVLAFREINEWKFIKPILIGDVIHAELTTIEARALPRIGGGSVVLKTELKNQADEVCMKGKLNVLVLARPA